MNINAKQMLSVDYHSMDNTTALGFFGQIKDIVTQDAQVTAALSTVWTAFTAAYNAFDNAYAQARKSAQTEDIAALDTARDQALSAFLSALKCKRL